MIEYLLFGVIVALLVGFGWYVKESNRERTKLIHAILSKTPQDMVNMTLADQTEIVKPEVNRPSDVVPMDQLSDEEFDQHIQDDMTNQAGEQEL